ncbi:CLUMA_CG017744, isoform A [Clunio marinus]|uniref:CLUMA_CG017744, isoform A n=1 Tax=Clunio marinus TaxID=568069 RepID=A0A1J1IX49_9DIPT|nr:CLUMA_CG017744, isoform A [Clunio marinus]
MICSNVKIECNVERTFPSFLSRYCQLIIQPAVNVGCLKSYDYATADYHCAAASLDLNNYSESTSCSNCEPLILNIKNKHASTSIQDLVYILSQVNIKAENSCRHEKGESQFTILALLFRKLMDMETYEGGSLQAMLLSLLLLKQTTLTADTFHKQSTERWKSQKS